MRFTRFNFLLVAGLVFTLGLTTAFAGGGDKDTKRPKNTGTLRVKTSDKTFPVKVDGQYVGMSGLSEWADFYLAPGIHTIEVTGDNGLVWRDEIEVLLDRRVCICLKLVTRTDTKPCPYRFHLEGPDRITEGDLVTFAAINSGTAPIPLRYAWKVTNGRITSGIGTPSVTVDSTGLGGKTINAELDVNDDVYDSACRQVISVPTDVVPQREPETPKPYRCDEFESKSPDEDKARFDNCVIQAQNTPDSQLYIIIYPGTDRRSTTVNTYDRLSKRALDYLVKNRGFDPRRIQIVKGSTRLKTTFVLWIVPPGASLPPID